MYTCICAHINRPITLEYIKVSLNYLLKAGIMTRLHNYEIM